MVVHAAGCVEGFGEVGEGTSFVEEGVGGLDISEVSFGVIWSGCGRIGLTCKRSENGTHDLNDGLLRKDSKKTGQDVDVKLLPRFESNGVGRGNCESTLRRLMLDLLRGCLVRACGGGLLSNRSWISLSKLAFLACTAGKASVMTRKAIVLKNGHEWFPIWLETLRHDGMDDR